MANVMSMARLKNHTSRSGFDLSRKNAFTAKVGELLPVMVEECLPGDKFKIKPEWFTRTMPVNTAAYTRIKEYYDFYFVPNRLLWKYFPQFITQMDNSDSAMSSSAPVKSTITNAPFFTQGDIRNNLYIWNYYGVKNIFGRSFTDDSQKLLNYLDYGWYDWADRTNKSNLQLNPFPLLAYQKIYYDWFRDSQWENMSPACWNVDFCDPSKVGTSLFTQYGSYTTNENIFGLFSLRYANWHKDLYMGVLPRAQYGDESFAPIDFDNFTITGDSDYSSTYRLTPSYSGGGVAKEDTAVNAQIYGPTATAAQTTEQSLGIWKEGSDANYASKLEHKHTFTLDSSSGYDGNVAGSLSVLALRQAQALQKWKEIALAHNKNYKDQIKAHFGVTVSETLSNRCQYVGGTSNVVSIGEVVNNNLTGDAAANIQGKGTGNGFGKVDYDVKEHGIMMCIYHAEPLLDYTSTSVSRLNTKITPTDYAIPELDRIGMERVPSLYLADVNTTINWNKDTERAAFMSGTLGYAPRYWDYKTKVDGLHGGFSNTQYDSTIKKASFYQWVAPRAQKDMYSYFNSGKSLSNYVFFKINPTVLNTIFVQAATSSISTDQLLVNANFDVKAVRNLDYDGLPY